MTFFAFIEILVQVAKKARTNGGRTNIRVTLITARARKLKTLFWEKFHVTLWPKHFREISLKKGQEYLKV